MVTQSFTPADVEPTPEFDSRCMGLIHGWRTGDIPTPNVTQELKELAREAATSGHAANQGRAEHLSGYIQHYLGNYKVSNMHYENARRLFQRVGNPRRLATMDLNMGENYRHKGEFKRARRLYHDAYEAAAKLDDLRLRTIAIINEGLMLVSLKEYHNAQKALEEGLVLSEQWEDTDQLQALCTEIHYGMAQIQIALGAFTEAWKSAYESLENASTSNNLVSVGLAYRILGDVLTTLGEPQEGATFETPDEYFRAALDTFREIDAQAEIGRTQFHHAKSLAARGRRRPAAQLFREAMVIFTRLGMTNDAAHAAEAQLAVF